MIHQLIELRKQLIQCLIVVGLVFLLLYPFSSSLFHQFALPLLQQLLEHQKLIATTLTGAFFGPIQFCLFLALFLSAPFILYRLWRFIAPGLYQKERLFVQALLLGSVLLFYLGVIFAYAFIFPTIMLFLIHVAPPDVLVTPDISAYLHFSLRLLLAFGFAFEMPILVILAIQAQLVSKKTLQHKRRYIIVFNFVLGMLLTPDVVSQMMLALPLCLLFELGLWVSGFSFCQLKPINENIL